MIYSINWLKEFVDIEKLSASSLAEKLTMAGIEVERVEQLESEITGVITAEVLTIENHPNADRLSLCTVNAGDGSNTFSIVCGAKNMKIGDKVALALDGAVLPGGGKLKRTRIRGSLSEGMMCSESELGLTTDGKSEGILILPSDTKLGLNVADVFGLTDTLLHVAILPDRADCLSIRGLAREIAAITGEKFKDKTVTTADANGGPFDSDKSIRKALSVRIDSRLCRRYTARVVKGVDVGESPLWLKTRIERLGIRSINNVVDATNYVMLELGQPLHAFDMDKIAGGELVVRTACEDELVHTIVPNTAGEHERKLSSDMLVIADGEQPQAVAGVMGGLKSEVTDKTRTVILESAFFDPSSVRRTSKRLGLSSESSYRFERGVDLLQVAVALDALACLVKELAGGGILKGMIDEYPDKYKSRTIEFRIKRAARMLGVSLNKTQVKKIFKPLGIEVRESRKKGSICALPPSYRMDICFEADLLEEVARVVGYDKIPETTPLAGVLPPILPESYELKNNVRDQLASYGFYEVINYSFVSSEDLSLFGPSGRDNVKVLNPLSEDQSVLRDTLLPSLRRNLQYNVARKNEQVNIFELRPVFLPTGGGLPEERLSVSALMYGSRRVNGWNEKSGWVDFFDIKGALTGLLDMLGVGEDVEYCAIDESGEEGGRNVFFHPGKSATVKIGGKYAGVIGELHPDLMEMTGIRNPAYLFEINLEIVIDRNKEPRFCSLMEKELNEALCRPERAYVPPARYPGSTRDLAFFVDSNLPYSDIIREIKKINAKVIENVELFDVYYGENIPKGKKSFAVRVNYRSAERTLTFDEVEQIHSQIRDVLVSGFKAEIRS